jgi:hypothetical protein
MTMKSSLLFAASVLVADRGSLLRHPTLGSRPVQFGTVVSGRTIGGRPRSETSVFGHAGKVVRAKDVANQVAVPIGDAEDPKKCVHP